jgi:trigger factor
MYILRQHNVAVTKNEGKEAVITGVIPTELLKKHEPAALKFFSENLSVDGFRKGSIPEKVLRKHVSEVTLLEETASRALNELYPEIVREEKLDVFGRPRVVFTKLAPNNPVEFTIVTPLAPKVDIADYKTIAKEINAERVGVVLEEPEVEKALLEVRKELDRLEAHNKEGGHEKEETDGEERGGKEEAQPSPLTDEKVQKIAPVKTVDEFRTLVRADLQKHKENQANEKHRLMLIEKILEKSNVTLPEVLIESELEGMMAQFSSDVAQAGVTMEGYLAQASKTKEDLLKEWRPHAEKRAKMQMILNKIASEEKLFPKKEEVEGHAARIVEHNPGIERRQAEVYVEIQRINANVLSFLEKL